MSNDVPKWYKTQYDDKVRHKFQAKGFRFKDTVTPETKIEGSDAVFRVMGKSVAQKKVRGQAARRNSSDKITVKASLETFEFLDEVEDFDADRVGAGEKDAVAKSGAMAVGRGVDHEIIGRIYDNSNTAAPEGGSSETPLLSNSGLPGLVGGNDVDFSLAHLLLMQTALQEADVPWDGNVYCPLPAMIWNQACAYKQFNSADWVGDQLSFLNNSVSKFWNGVHYFLAPNEFFPRFEDGHYDLIAWHKEAVGYADNNQLSSKWQYDIDYGVQKIRLESVGAVAVLQKEGLVRARVKVPTNITLN